jgi:hypothetical protein
LRSGRRGLAAIPPLVVGASVAGAAEMSAGLLLYSEEGFLPALTLILTVETGALALGIWSGSVSVHQEAVESLRRRWLFVLVTFAIAAAFSTGLTFLGQIFTGGIGQGLGLAFLGSLPLFALGSLLSGMIGSGESSVGRVGLPAVVGVAVGFLLTGGFLLPNLAPYTLYLFCLTALSGGALIHGWVLDSRGSTHLVEEEWTPRGLLRVEDRVQPGGRGGVRAILEGGRLRGAEADGGSSGRDWENGVMAALKGEGGDPSPALYLGGGSGCMARDLLDAFPGLQLLVVEGTEAFVSLARKHFHPFERWDEVQLRVGEPWGVLNELQDRYALVLLDLGFLPSVGLLPDMNGDRWAALASLAGTRGSVVLGGLPLTERLGEVPLEGLLSGAGHHFPRVAHYEGEDEGFILLSASEAPNWSPVLPGFQITATQEE